MKVKFTKTKSSKNYYRFEPQISLIKGNIYIPKKYLDEYIQVLEVNISVEPEDIPEIKSKTVLTTNK